MIRDLVKPILAIPAFRLEDLITEFQYNLSKYSYVDLFSLLKDEETDLIFLTVIRAAIRAKEKKSTFTLTLEAAEKKAAQVRVNRRKRFVRRIYNRTPLFAIQYIRERYPDYRHEDLAFDLLLKKKPGSSFKSKPSKNDFRSSQLQKLKDLIKYEDPQSLIYHKACTTIALMLQAQKRKECITLTVRLGGELKGYYFKWNTLERVIKSFHAMANQKGMTHERLEELKHELIISSMYSKF
ncbi:hypothetical protein WG906_18360 [Pedobacter sp. P351]|uniref:hypothetical protein n=1 Tax=Pedobacter superstes TaxID=3133441 RepID=UPI0030993935